MGVGVSCQKNGVVGVGDQKNGSVEVEGCRGDTCIVLFGNDHMDWVKAGVGHKGGEEEEDDNGVVLVVGDPNDDDRVDDDQKNESVVGDV